VRAVRTTADPDERLGTSDTTTYPGPGPSNGGNTPTLPAITLLYTRATAVLFELCSMEERGTELEEDSVPLSMVSKRTMNRSPPKGLLERLIFGV
jgi:hypothetical protein